ncbi:MAG TPA: hypothetical protein VMN38_02055 [Sphingomicrobium sp.]|nr:hypothetical protein [Sphingomicrobium sp.]
MTRLVLVHGINQQGKSEELLRKDWVCHICRGLGKAGALDQLEIDVPFYGDELKRLSDTSDVVAVSQGPDGKPDADEAAFLASALMETASEAGIGPAAIAAEQRAIARQSGDLAHEQGLIMNRRFNAIVRLLERVSPLHGKLVMRILKQAHSYLKKPGAARAVDAIVGPALEQGPSIIVAHSLGTVVTFKLLRQMASEGNPVTVPLYVTVGSPLPLMAVQAALGPEFSRPPGVERWINAGDPDDFITLGKGLDKATFADGIENLLDVENDLDDPHSIGGYLADKRIATAIGKACGV